MIPRLRPLFALSVLLVACADTGVGFDYRVASRDPKVTSEQMLQVVNRSLDRPEGEGSGAARISRWAKVDEKTGEVTFGLGAVGSGRTPSIRNAESRLLRDLRYEFGDRVDLFCNGERLRADGTVEPRGTSATPSSGQGAGLGP